MTDQKNTILAIVLSALVLIGWQLYFGLPQIEKQKQIATAAGAGARPAGARLARAPDHGTNPSGARHDTASARPAGGHPGPANDAGGGARGLATRADRDAERLRARSRSRAGASTISR